MRMTSQFASMTSLSIFFDVCMFLLSSLVTGPSFMSISCLVLAFFCKGLTRNPEIKIPPSEFCPISGGWDESSTTVLSKMLLNAAKCQGCSFYRFFFYTLHWQILILQIFSNCLYEIDRILFCTKLY